MLPALGSDMGEPYVQMLAPLKNKSLHWLHWFSVVEQNQSLTVVKKAGGKQLLKLQNSLLVASLLDRFASITTITLEKWESIKNMERKESNPPYLDN